jgi:hypothetical protein
MKLKNAESKIKKLISLLKEIEDDCLQLKKQGELTEYGDGQFDLIQVIRQELRIT